MKEARGAMETVDLIDLEMLKHFSDGDERLRDPVRKVFYAGVVIARLQAENAALREEGKRRPNIPPDELTVGPLYRALEHEALRAYTAESRAAELERDCRAMARYALSSLEFISHPRECSPSECKCGQKAARDAARKYAQKGGAA